MNNKELLIDFIEYAKSRHIMPILHSNIEPLVDDYLRQQNLQQCNVIRSVCSHPKAEWKNTPWGYKICGLCNDIVEQTDV